MLPELGDKHCRYAQRKLAERGVDIRTGVKVASVADGAVTLSDGTPLEARTVVWTAGTSPHPMLQTIPCAKERGRVVVDEFLRAADGIWALGAFRFRTIGQLAAIGRRFRARCAHRSRKPRQEGGRSHDIWRPLRREPCGM